MSQVGVSYNLCRLLDPQPELGEGCFLPARDFAPSECWTGFRVRGGSGFGPLLLPSKLKGRRGQGGEGGRVRVSE